MNIKPNKKDLLDLKQFIEITPHTVGSINHAGIYTPSINPKTLWLKKQISKNLMDELWLYVGIPTQGSENAYAQMINGDNHHIDVLFYKLKMGLFRTAWVGNVSFQFSGLQVYVGSISGFMQYQICTQFQKFIEMKSKLYEDTNEAIIALKTKNSQKV